MKLIQAKLRGMGTTMETRWFDLSPQLNLFHFPDINGGRNFLRALQTINPPYSCSAVNPFRDFPDTLSQGIHTRRILPKKRTIALSVFSATPELVRELATLSQLLWETDRIEVGRRLDYSRWINFVELASSTRWNEISTDIQKLLDQITSDALAQETSVTSLIAGLTPADRIKGKTKERLENWLDSIPDNQVDEITELIQSTRKAVMRSDHFHIARKVVAKRLPLFTLLDSSNSRQPFSYLEYLVAQKARSDSSFIKRINEELSTSGLSDSPLQLSETKEIGQASSIRRREPSFTRNPPDLLRQLQTDVQIAIAVSRVLYSTEPVLLMNCPEENIPQELHGELAEFIVNLSTSCQCLYNYRNRDIFPAGAAGRRYSSVELDMAVQKTDADSTDGLDIMNIV